MCQKSVMNGATTFFQVNKKVWAEKVLVTYEVLWIHNIDAICIHCKSQIESLGNIFLNIMKENGKKSSPGQIFPDIFKGCHIHPPTPYHVAWHASLKEIRGNFLAPEMIVKARSFSFWLPTENPKST